MSQQTISRFFKVKSKVENSEIDKTKTIKKENDKLNNGNNDNIDDATEKTERVINSLNNFACTDEDSSVHKSSLTKSINYKKRKSTAPLKSTKKSKLLTDFEQQILDIKLNHMDKLLFVQNGYRYKLFGEDAKIASQILNIKLTDGKISFDFQNPNKNDYLYTTFAQASIPIERLLIHVRRLIVKGYRVGVVNQVETASIREENKLNNINTNNTNNHSNKSNSRIFNRTLSNVYSSGTFLNDEDLEKNINGKSIICIKESVDKKIHLVSVNVYIREIVYDEFIDDFTRYNLESRLYHLEPIEIITIGHISNETLTCISNFRKSNQNNLVNISLIKKEIEDFSNTELIEKFKNELSINDDNILSFFTTLDITLLECFYKLTEYLKEFDLTNVFNFFENYKKFSDIDNNTILDSSVIKNLELFKNITTNSEQGSLFEIIDYTFTKFGQRILKYWIQRPLITKSNIIERHDAVESLINKKNSLQIERVKNVLKSCPDLELILSRIHFNRSNRKEVYVFLKKINEILSTFKNFRDELISLDTLNSDLLHTIFNSLKLISENELLEFQNLLNMINPQHAINNKSTDHLVQYFNSNFFDFNKIQIENEKIEKIHGLLNDELENVRRLTKNKDLQYIKVNNEPFLIQIRKSNIKHVPSDWIRISATLNCARYRTPEIIKLYKKLQYHQDILKIVCDELFLKFTEKINSFYPYISKFIKNLGYLDALISLSVSAINNNFTKPKIVDIATIQIKNGRNPITERLFKEKITNSINNSKDTNYIKPVTYIENDFTIQRNIDNDNSRIALITGPNMGGKSSFIKQVGLIIILSQIGSFIPCSENSILGIFSNICIRLGSNDDIFTGKSTFQVELSECYKILQTCIDFNKDENLPKIGKIGNSLILMDELGRGTSTIDGCSIAWSVLNYLINDFSNSTITLFVTHFKELEIFEKLSSGIVKNYHMGYKILKPNNSNSKIDDILFTYKLLPGYSDGSYGVYCAKIAGMPNDVINKAKEISVDTETKALKRNFDKLIKIINSKDVEKIFNITDLI